MTAAKSAVPMRYCYAIDWTKATPEEMNQLWEQMYPHEPLRSAFFVTTQTEDAFYRRYGLLSEERDSWWLREGGGSTLVDDQDVAIDVALLRFLVENREMFSRIWYGVASKDPDELEVRVQLQETGLVDGDAA